MLFLRLLQLIFVFLLIHSFDLDVHTSIYKIFVVVLSYWLHPWFCALLITLFVLCLLDISYVFEVKEHFRLCGCVCSPTLISEIAG